MSPSYVLQSHGVQGCNREPAGLSCPRLQVSPHVLHTPKCSRHGTCKLHPTVRHPRSRPLLTSQNAASLALPHPSSTGVFVPPVQPGAQEAAPTFRPPDDQLHPLSSSRPTIRPRRSTCCPFPFPRPSRLTPLCSPRPTSPTPSPTTASFPSLSPCPRPAAIPRLRPRSPSPQVHRHVWPQP